MRAGQETVYSTVAAPLLLSVLDGFDAALLAYGQTGSGKTYSLLSMGGGVGEAAEGSAGLFPRLVADLFTAAAADFRSIFAIDFCALQVYNDTVDDLLRPAGSNLRVRTEAEGVPAFVEGAHWAPVSSAAALLEAFKSARRRLVYAETELNKHSSRSHCILQLRVQRTQRPAEDGAESTVRQLAGRLVLVDLAGSERVKKSGAEGARLREASSINGSLLALGNCVAALASRQRHVPFRDSVLTRLLEGCLGGRSRTALLCCITPEAEHASESLGALEFAARAMRIITAPLQNSSLVLLSPAALAAALSRSAESGALASHGRIILRLEAALGRSEAALRDTQLALGAAQAHETELGEEGARLRSRLSIAVAERERAVSEAQQASAAREFFAAAASAAEAQRREAAATAEAALAEQRQLREDALQEGRQLRSALQQEKAHAEEAAEAAASAARGAQEAMLARDEEQERQAALFRTRIDECEAATEAIRAAMAAQAAASEQGHQDALARLASAQRGAADAALLVSPIPLRKMSRRGRTLARLWRVASGSGGETRLEWSADLDGRAWKGISLAAAAGSVADAKLELRLQEPRRPQLILLVESPWERAWAAALLRRLALP